MPKQRLPIGWREWVALPDLGVETVKAKVDTGARSSALHAWDIDIEQGPDGTSVVHFTVHPFQRSMRQTIRTQAPLTDLRVVRASSGHEEQRPVIVTTVALLGNRWPIELTLTQRDAMGFRMLLGRQAIRTRFLVDPGRSFVGGKPRKDP